MSEERKYIPVDIATLKAGMLVERSLYAYFSGNQKHIRLVGPLQPLDAARLEKLQKIGSVFTTEPSIEERFQELMPVANAVREWCDNRETASFEKNRVIRESTRWLATLTLARGGDFVAPLFFFHRAFGVPAGETLEFVSDLSVVMYERCLKTAAVAGLLALWLGYSDTQFLSQFATAVFCEEVARYSVSTVLDDAELANAEQVAAAAAMIAEGKVPGVNDQDHRFRAFLAQRNEAAAGGDELAGVAQYARWLTGVTSEDDAAADGRVARKLKKFFVQEEKKDATAPEQAVAA